VFFNRVGNANERGRGGERESGRAQVKYRYGASVEDALMKVQYDLFYIKHQGPYIDLLILLKTVQVVLGFQGR